MARTPSKILTAAEKKTVLADLKAQLKVSKDELKKHTTFKKEKEKMFAARQKEELKLHTACIKDADKEIAAATKAVAALEKQIAAHAA